MLDFYIISDSEVNPKPDKIDNLDYAGGLEYDIYERLVRKGIINSRFDFYSDFRWGNSLVKQIDSKAKEFSSDSDVTTLKKIVEKAMNAESGLITLGD
jgi:hypothetical protein